MDEMISLGAGINSVAMTVLLVSEGWRGSIGFADTGGEKPDTYCYLDYFEREFLAPHGLGLTRLEPASQYHCSMSQVPLEDYCLKAGVIPLLAVRWCSSRWKGRPLDRWAKSHGITSRHIGISVDEAWRADGKRDWRQFPLVEHGINREGCRALILHAGLEVPLWSSCFFCPGQTLGEWRYIHDHYPELWERAKRLEANASERYEKRATLNTHLSLEEMEKRGWDVQGSFDLSAWMPCLCRL